MNRHPPAIMASSPLLPSASLLLLLLLLGLPQLEATSQACKSQTFSHTTTKFTNCTDLPTLNASLHWTYDAAARPGPMLSIAYVAPPARPDGWVAWALNPTGSGMVGAQALAAFANGSGLVVMTYNISSYGPIAESEIAYSVTARRAEHSGGLISLFAKLGLPPGSAAAAIHQVWQVGASVKGGVPVKHDFSPENLKSMGSLLLTDDGAVASPSPAPVSGAGETPSIPRGNNLGGSGRKYGGSFFGVHGLLVLLGVFWGF